MEKTAHIFTNPMECAFCYSVTMGVVRYEPTQKLHPCCPDCWEAIAEGYRARGKKLWTLV